MEDFMENFQKNSKKAWESPFIWKISKSFMELFPCELGDPIAVKKKKKMTQGWVVYGGMRHAEPQREMFPRS
jgi:hypothetical protein